MIFVVAVIAGVLIGIYMPVNISNAYSPIVAVALLAGLDSIFGGWVAHLKGKFNFKIFVTGFFGNALIAAGLVWLGRLLGVDLTIAAVVVFGSRLFNNFATLRRYGLEELGKYLKKRKMARRG